MKHICILFAVCIGMMATAQTSSENYVKTTTYQKEVKEGQLNTVGEADKIEAVQYFDGLGRIKQEVAVRGGGQGESNNLLNWRKEWKEGLRITAFFNNIGQANENLIINTNDTPFGIKDLVWRCGNDNTSGPDGGWNTQYFPVDKNMGYRYAVWVKRTGSQDGSAYHGTKNVNNLNGTANNNPYFWNGDLPAINQWYLLVGIVHPHTYGTTNSGISGVYDTNGNKVGSATDLKWRNTTTTSQFRSYFFYSTDTNTKQYFWNPVLQKLDGSEGSVQELIESQRPKDIITHHEYDAYGRPQKSYLPYAKTSGNGAIAPNPLAELTNFYNTPKYENTTNPYTENKFEPSPLNRVKEHAAPGESWKMSSGHTIKNEWTSNTGSEVVYFRVNFTEGNPELPTLIKDGNYTDNELQVTISKDENWKSGDGNNRTTKEYVDKLGRTILKRAYNSNQAHDTYYVYDDYGNLTFVIPPKVTTNNGVSATELKELCYQYKYDHRNRLVEKKIPGKGWEYNVYNRLDKPVLTQDANQRTRNEWLFTKYDAFGRVAFTGLHVHPSNISRTALQQLANNTQTYSQWVDKRSSYNLAGTNIFYTNDAIPTGVSKVYIINYYDDYTFDKAGLSLPSQTSFGTTLINHNDTNKGLTKGLSSGTKVRVLETDTWITTLTGYDNKGRVIYVVSKNEYLGTTDIVETKRDFTGRIQETKTTHKKTGQVDIVTRDFFTYDHAGRQLTHRQKINNFKEELISKNHYDELGQLEAKSVGGKIENNALETPLQTINYTYNVRGWLKTINQDIFNDNDLFSFSIGYDSGSHALYNGNISSTDWSTSNDNTYRSYAYQYDALNRITNANSDDGRYSLFNVTYDKMGNIKGFVRNGATNANGSSFGIMDQLTYTYDAGNKLRKVQDFSGVSEGFKDGSNSNDDYVYDANGNITVDRNKGITNITYNHLNLPTEVDVTAGPYNGLGPIYTYDALGNKLSKRVTVPAPNPITHYAGNFVYQDNKDASKLQFVHHPEGYTDATVSRDKTGIYHLDRIEYIYQHKDHLGNIRLSFSDNNDDGKISAPYMEVWKDDFESQSGWGGLTSYDTSKKISGQYSGKIVKTSAGEKVVHSTEWVYIDNDVPTEYVFSGWVYSDNPSVDLFLFEKKEGETGYFTHVESVRTTTKNKWVYVEKRVTVGTNIVRLNLRLDNNGGGTVWFDDIKIVKVNNTSISEIREVKDYYPFGLKIQYGSGHPNSLITGRKHNYEFSGKENNDELGLEWLDFGARNYDASIGRWMNIDPLAEEMYPQSTYNYAFNNPILFLDPDGRKPFPGPFTGSGYRQSNGVINVLRVTASQRYAVGIYTEIANKTTGWIGTANATYHAIFNPKTDSVLEGGLRAATPTATRGTGKFIDALVSDNNQVITSNGKRIIPGKYDIHHFKGLSNAIIKPGLKVIGWASLAEAVSNNGASHHEVLQDLTYQFGDKLIANSWINISNEGIFQVNNKNGTSVEQVESRLNSIYAGLGMALGDYDLGTKEGIKGAQDFLSDQENIRLISHFIRFLWNLNNQEDNEDNH